MKRNQLILLLVDEEGEKVESWVFNTAAIKIIKEINGVVKWIENIDFDICATCNHDRYWHYITENDDEPDLKENVNGRCKAKNCNCSSFKN